MREAVFLVEAGAKSGMGHLRRCSVLARELSKRGVACQFGINTHEGRSIMDTFPVADYKSALAKTWDILIVDGYHFESKNLSKWKNECRILVLVDDLAQKPLPAHIVLNHNIYGESLDYKAYPANIVLSGPKFTLVDPAFSKLRKNRVIENSSILVAFGGGDTANQGLLAAAELAAITEGTIIDVAMGTSKRRIDHPNISVHEKANMVKLMSKTALYFGALGVSFIEALAAGLPVVGVMTADNQILAADAARRLGIPVFDLNELDKAAKKAASLVKHKQFAKLEVMDGLGAKRVANEILAFNCVIV